MSKPTIEELRESREVYIHNRNEYRKEIEQLEALLLQSQVKLKMATDCLLKLYNYKGDDRETFIISIGVILKAISEE